MPVFKTIRQTAATGLLPEHRLRIMQKQGSLPGFCAGNRFLVNVDALVEYLNAESQKSVSAKLSGGGDDAEKIGV